MQTSNGISQHLLKRALWSHPALHGRLSRHNWAVPSQAALKFSTLQQQPRLSDSTRSLPLSLLESLGTSSPNTSLKPIVFVTARLEIPPNPQDDVKNSPEWQRHMAMTHRNTRCTIIGNDNEIKTHIRPSASYLALLRRGGQLGSCLHEPDPDHTSSRFAQLQYLGQTLQVSSPTLQRDCCARRFGGHALEAD